jgi:2-oxoglutarate ferredoxin oxidoreductase subunit beta
VGKKDCSVLFDVPYQYCQGVGCTHNTLTVMLGEIIEELGIREETILVGPVGCSEQIINYLDVDAIGAPHGRALSLATGIKRSLPDRIVITYQGDGDFASIGIAEAVHTGARGEKISTIWVNNGVYGMTGGQMSVTTLLGQKTSTTPEGRTKEAGGNPLHVSEMLAGLAGTAFISREAINTRANMDRCRSSIVKSIRMQMEGRGFNAVEVLGICPTNWRMSTKEAIRRLEDEVMKEYPLGVKKDASKGVGHG